ncbi:MAG: hypothetical protein R6W70_11335 [bacterium]
MEALFKAALGLEDPWHVKARGYSTKRNLIAIVYLMLGKLNYRSVNACCQPT